MGMDPLAFIRYLTRSATSSIWKRSPRGPAAAGGLSIRKPATSASRSTCAAPPAGRRSRRCSSSCRTMRRSASCRRMPGRGLHRADRRAAGGCGAPRRDPGQKRRLTRASWRVPCSPDADAAGAAPRRNPGRSSAVPAAGGRGGAGEAEARRGEARREARSVKVPADKLDRLIDLVGELVIAGAGTSCWRSGARPGRAAGIRRAGDAPGGGGARRALQLRMVPIGDHLQPLSACGARCQRASWARTSSW
jgi:hypothetical protein